MPTTKSLFSIISFTFLLMHSILDAHELPFIISVCAYNAAAWVEKNLNSICEQKYSNYHIVYVDDASSDDTVQKVEEYIQMHHLQDKITLIANPMRLRKMQNIYHVFHDCPDESIIIQVDADDWLAHDHVFSQINTIYQQEDVWLTYGQFQVHPDNKIGYCKEVPTEIQLNRDYRKYRFVYTHLRTFYAWLVKSIQLQDLLAEHISPLYNGKFFPVANDNATYFPMLEMCGNRFTFIPDVLYIHNHGNPNYGRAIEIELYNAARADIRSRPKYPIIEQPNLNRLAPFEHAQATAIIFSQDNPSGLKRLLRSLYEQVEDLKEVIVLYQASTAELESGYKQAHMLRPHIQQLPCTSAICEQLRTIIERTNSNHLLLMQDFVYINEPLALSEQIKELERTGAFGFYYTYGLHDLPFYFPSSKKEHIASQEIKQGIHAWKFNCGIYALYNNIDMTLLRTTDFLTRLATIHEAQPRSLTDFLSYWHANRLIDGQKVGLFFKKRKLVGKRTGIFAPAIEKPHVSALTFEHAYKYQPWYLDGLTEELMDFFE